MKRFLPSLLLSLALPSAALAQGSQHERDFVAASERALSGDPAGAIALYTTLLDQGVVNEDLYFNLGNVYADSGKRVEAVLAYERALLLAPGDTDVRANLEAVRAELAPKEPAGTAAAAPEKASQLGDVLEPLVGPLNASLFFGLALGSNALLFLALLLRHWTGGERRRRWASALVLVSALALFGSGLVVGGQWMLSQDPRAVALSSVELKEGPHPRFQAKGKVQAGERVRVQREEGGWELIASASGQSGWVPSDKVERIRH